VVAHHQSYCATVTFIVGCTSTTCITIDSLYPAQVKVITGYVLSDTLGPVRGKYMLTKWTAMQGNVFEEKAVVDIGQGVLFHQGLEPGVYLLKADFNANTRGLLYIPSYHLSAYVGRSKHHIQYPTSLP
jgi:hypothetical protein